jgi:hypothetical protein
MPATITLPATAAGEMCTALPPDAVRADDHQVIVDT